MLRLKIVSVFIATLIALPCHAVTAERLYGWLTSDNNSELNFGRAYVVGVADVFDRIIGNGSSYCIKLSNVTSTELAEIVIEYFLEHPEGKSQPAVVLAKDALTNSFPCDNPNTY